MRGFKEEEEEEEEVSTPKAGKMKGFEEEAKRKRGRPSK